MVKQKWSKGKLIIEKEEKMSKSEEGNEVKNEERNEERNEENND